MGRSHPSPSGAHGAGWKTLPATERGANPSCPRLERVRKEDERRAGSAGLRIPAASAQPEPPVPAAKGAQALLQQTPLAEPLASRPKPGRAGSAASPAAPLPEGSQEHFCPADMLKIESERYCCPASKYRKFTSSPLKNLRGRAYCGARNLGNQHNILKSIIRYSDALQRSSASGKLAFPLLSLPCFFFCCFFFFRLLCIRHRPPACAGLRAG